MFWNALWHSKEPQVRLVGPKCPVRDRCIVGATGSSRRASSLNFCVVVGLDDTIIQGTKRIYNSQPSLWDPSA